MTMTKTLLAVDGNSLVHRSFHAQAGSNLRSADGRPTWAVNGFLHQMLGALDRVGADGLVVGFDDHGNSVRKAQWPHYKATRKPKPPELGQQIATTIEVLRAAGVHVVVPDGLEADDVLASAAASATAAGWHTVILTSDRDSFALVTETTSVLRLINGGVDGSPLLNPNRLHILTGVHPHQYREYAAMRGDTSDNLAGIRGVGEKTAAKLLAEFGTVGAAMADVDAGGAAVAAALGRAAVGKLADEDNREAFTRNCQIMTMREDLNLGLDFTTPGAGLLPLDPAKVGAALDSLSLARVKPTAVRLLTGPKMAAHAVTPEPVDVIGYAPALDELAPPAEDDAFQVVPVRAVASATAAAMAGSSVARPATWDETLF